MSLEIRQPDLNKNTIDYLIKKIKMIHYNKCWWTQVIKKSKWLKKEALRFQNWIFLPSTFKEKWSQVIMKMMTIAIVRMKVTIMNRMNQDSLWQIVRQRKTSLSNKRKRSRKRWWPTSNENTEIHNNILPILHPN